MKYPALLMMMLLLLSGVSVKPQNELNWWNPVEHEAVEGLAWTDESEYPYHRLPGRAQNLVREPVWNLSKHTAGVLIRFQTNATDITVRYQVSGSLDMQHMPATGVSGVDLYLLDSDNNWRWCRGNRDFSDTISYEFSGLSVIDGVYNLYLPLYNHVDWLQIGVNNQSVFSLLPVRDENPIVVYGTSIAQGACASRPGMGWTNIVSREMGYPLINLAFSGNGRLEPELIELLAEIDAKVYVLDCLPNLTNESTYSEQELTRRISFAVKTLKEQRPNTPILLVEHAGYTDGLIQEQREAAYQRVNRIQKEVFDQLKKAGVTGLHYLSHDEINLQLDDMVDGTHPNDLGMMHYAEAYKMALEPILIK